MAGAGGGGKTVPLGHQEPISRNAQRGVMVESAPVATFKVPQPQLLFQLLIIPFDDPAMLGHLDQGFELSSNRQRRHPILRGLSLAAWPFDQQPFLRVRFRFFVIPMSCAYAKGGKAGSQLPVCAFPPSDFLESRRGQTHRQLLHGDGLVVRGPLQ